MRGRSSCHPLVARPLATRGRGPDDKAGGPAQQLLREVVHADPHHVFPLGQHPGMPLMEVQSLGEVEPTPERDRGSRLSGGGPPGARAPQEPPERGEQHQVADDDQVLGALGGEQVYRANALHCRHSVQAARTPARASRAGASRTSPTAVPSTGIRLTTQRNTQSSAAITASVPSISIHLGTYRTGAYHLNPMTDTLSRLSTMPSNVKTAAVRITRKSRPRYPWMNRAAGSATSPTISSRYQAPRPVPRYTQRW